MRAPKCPLCGTEHWSTQYCPVKGSHNPRKRKAVSKDKKIEKKNKEIISVPAEIQIRLGARERSRRWRENHRDEYNKQMRALMRERRKAAKKARKAAKSPS